MKIKNPLIITFLMISIIFSSCNYTETTYHIEGFGNLSLTTPAYRIETHPFKEWNTSILSRSNVHGEILGGDTLLETEANIIRQSNSRYCGSLNISIDIKEIQNTLPTISKFFTKLEKDTILGKSWELAGVVKIYLDSNNNQAQEYSFSTIATVKTFEKQNVIPTRYLTCMGIKDPDSIAPSLTLTWSGTILTDIGPLELSGDIDYLIIRTQDEVFLGC